MPKKFAFDDNVKWKQRFRASRIWWAKIATQNPQRGLVCTDRDGILQLYAWDRSTDELQRRTDQPAGVREGIISADGEYIYYLHDEGGNEIGHFVRVPFSGGEQQDVTPDLPPYASFFISQSFFGNQLSTRVALADEYTLYAFAPDEVPRQLYKSSNLFLGPSISCNGEIVVIASTEGTGSMDTQLLALDSKSGEQIAVLWEGAGVGHSYGDFSPLPDDFRMLSSSSKSGFTRPIIWDPMTDVVRELQIDEITGDVEAWGWSRDAKQVLLSQLDCARRQLYMYDLVADRVSKLQHPAGLVGSHYDHGVFTEENNVLITWQDFAHPSRLIQLDSSSNEPRTVLLAGDVPSGRPCESITYISENGDSIQAWLGLPEGDGPFPTIFHVKGGPNTVMVEYFLPDSQAWMDHGFAFFSINYHGAITLGKEFEKSIMGQLGELEIQDMAAGHHWLVEQGIAQPEAVFVTGGSYGGYLTLLALGRRPELWAGGMAGIAIADWTLIYEDSSDALRGYQRVLFGGKPDERPEAYKKSSPITYADQIQAPLLVIQGSNDTRCPARQMHVYEEKMKSLGKEIEVHWFEAGHGSRAQEQQIEHQELSMRFVQRILES